MVTEIRKGITLPDKTYAYIVNHPGCSTSEIAKALNVNVSKVYMAAASLTKYRMVSVVKGKGNNYWWGVPA